MLQTLMQKLLALVAVMALVLFAASEVVAQAQAVVTKHPVFTSFETKHFVCVSVDLGPFICNSK